MKKKESEAKSWDLQGKEDGIWGGRIVAEFSVAAGRCCPANLLSWGYPNRRREKSEYSAGRRGQVDSFQPGFLTQAIGPIDILWN